MSVKANQVDITSPCPITLDRSAVSAKDRAMFCAHCTKDVHLLSQMTESETRELMKAEAGRDICVSYSTRDDGSIRFRPEPKLVPVTSLRRRPTHASAPAIKFNAPRRLSMVATLGATMLLAACTTHGKPEAADGIKAQPVVVEVVTQPEVEEQTPCDGPEYPAVAGGLRAEPLPELPPEEFVDGGIRAEPLPEPIPEAQPEPPAVTPKISKPHVRGGMKARPIEHAEDPLAQL